MKLHKTISQRAKGGEGVRRLQMFWSWWNSAPPGQIVRAAIIVTGINIAILVAHLLVMW